MSRCLGFCIVPESSKRCTDLLWALCQDAAVVHRASHLLEAQRTSTAGRMHSGDLLSPGGGRHNHATLGRFDCIDRWRAATALPGRIPPRSYHLGSLGVGGLGVGLASPPHIVLP